MIELKGISKSFTGHTVLDDVNLYLPNSSVLALVGPNGSGKSTLLKILLGLVLPEKGHLHFEDPATGNETNDLRKFTGYMPQTPSFPANLKVREIIRFLDDLNGSDPEFHNEIVDDLGIRNFYEKTFSDLSGGMKQKVNILQCFRSRKSLYILDEPTVSLDPKMAFYLKNLVKQRKQAGAAVVFTSHIMHEVEDLADRIVLLVEGKMKLEKNLAELKSESGKQSLEESLQDYWSHH